jgi:hypothetical protein
MTPPHAQASAQRLLLRNPERMEAIPHYHIVSARTAEIGGHYRLAPEGKAPGRYFELYGPHALLVVNAAEVASVLLQIEQQG